jgi:hypothetical protein
MRLRWLLFGRIEAKSPVYTPCTFGFPSRRSRVRAPSSASGERWKTAETACKGHRYVLMVGRRSGRRFRRFPPLSTRSVGHLWVIGGPQARAVTGATFGSSSVGAPRRDLRDGRPDRQGFVRGRLVTRKDSSRCDVEALVTENDR